MLGAQVCSLKLMKLAARESSGESMYESSNQKERTKRI